MAEFTGRCLCGAVTWATDAVPLWAGHCHCDSCRRACSAPFTSFFGVPRDTVRWQGRIAEYHSSPAVRRGFCPGCGSQLFYQSTRWPDETHLYAATLTEPDRFVPQAHFHWAERLPNVHITDDLPKYAASAETSDPV